MISWGINALNHGSSISVFLNNELIDNLVFDKDIPDKLPNVMPDRIYWYERPWLKKLRQIYAGQYLSALDINDIPKVLTRKWGLENVPIIYTPHHASHAASGYYTSSFDQCAIVVLDAIGEFDCSSIWQGKDNTIKKVWSKSYPNSLGLFYSAFTKLIGLQPIKEEGLLEQLSQEGNPLRFYKDVKSYLTKNLHKGVANWPHSIVSLQDKKDIAASVQLIFEEEVEKIMIIARNITQSTNLVYMGGCAMNKTANDKILKNWDNSWILKNPGDPSSSIGCVLYHTRQRLIRV